MLDRIERLERRCTWLSVALIAAMCPWLFGAGSNQPSNPVRATEVTCQKITITDSDGKTVGRLTGDKGGSLSVANVIASGDVKAKSVWADSLIGVGKEKTDGATLFPTALVIAKDRTPLAIFGAGAGEGDTSKLVGNLLIRDAASGKDIRIDARTVSWSENADGTILLKRTKEKTEGGETKGH